MSRVAVQLGGGEAVGERVPRTPPLEGELGLLAAAAGGGSIGDVAPLSRRVGAAERDWVTAHVEHGAAAQPGGRQACPLRMIP